MRGIGIPDSPFFKSKGGFVLKSGKSIMRKQKRAGWYFLAIATILILLMNFWPMIQAFVMSLKKGPSSNMVWQDPLFHNYERILKDKTFQTAMKNTFLYLIIEVPIMLILAIILAQVLNNKDLKFRGLFRTMVFMPCAVSLVSYALIFKSLFATEGLVNSALRALRIISSNINWLGTTSTARAVIIIGLIWRWTGYNMVFFLAGLQNIEYSVYEAAKIDGASSFNIFRYITVPLLKPIIVMTGIMSINGTLQLFDESVNLTNGGPSNTTITMSHYIWNQSFGQGVAKFGYASSLAFVVFIMVGILAYINLKVGDTRD